MFFKAGWIKLGVEIHISLSKVISHNYDVPFIACHHSPVVLMEMVETIPIRKMEAQGISFHPRAAKHTSSVILPYSCMTQQPITQTWRNINVLLGKPDMSINQTLLRSNTSISRMEYSKKNHTYLVH